MPAYVIAEVTVNDPEIYAQYAAGAPATVAAHGGKYLARGGPVEAIEGGWDPKRMAILEFPDSVALLAWYYSPEYTALRSLRSGAATVRLIAVPGVQ